jgi:hypothetical protein
LRLGRFTPLRNPAGHARGYTMGTDAKKIASEGKWWYISSQTKGKTEIPGK